MRYTAFLANVEGISRGEKINTTFTNITLSKFCHFSCNISPGVFFYLYIFSVSPWCKPIETAKMIGSLVSPTDWFNLRTPCIGVMLGHCKNLGIEYILYIISIAQNVNRSLYILLCLNIFVDCTQIVRKWMDGWMKANAFTWYFGNGFFRDETFKIDPVMWLMRETDCL